MTAFLAVRRPDFITVLVDGVVYDASGVVRLFARKFQALQASNSVFVTRGILISQKDILEKLAPFTSLSAMMEKADDVVSDTSMKRREIGDFEVFIAGVEDGHARYFYSPVGGEFREIEDFYFAAGPELDFETMRSVGYRPIDRAADFDSVTHGMPIMEAFRRTPENGLYGVGGFVSETCIGVDGIHSRIIHHWPDKIGQRISPGKPQ